MRWLPFLRGMAGIGPPPYHRDGRAWADGVTFTAWLILIAVALALVGVGFLIGRA